jgi:hypothetical protein
MRAAQGLGRALVVASRAAAARGPGERAPGDPPPGREHEAPLGPGQRDHPQPDAVCGGVSRWRVAGAGLVRVGELHALAGRLPDGSGEPPDPGAVPLVGGGDVRRRRVAQRVDCRVRLGALAALGAVLPAGPAAAPGRGLRRAAVEDGGRGAAPAASLPTREQARVADHAPEHARGEPAPALLVDDPPWREAVRRRAPGSARARQPLERVERTSRATGGRAAGRPLTGELHGLDVGSPTVPNRPFCDRVWQGPAWWPRRGFLAPVRGRRGAATGYGQAGGAGQSSRRARRWSAPALLRPHPASPPRRDTGRRPPPRIAAVYAAAASRLQRDPVPSRHIRRSTTASSRATATLARRMPARSATATPQAFSADQRPVRDSGTLAASWSARRARPSPCSLVRPARSVSPDWWRRGVRPKWAPSARSAESARVVGRRTEGQRGRRPHPGHRHRPPTDRLVARGGRHQAVQALPLGQRRLPRPPQRLDRRLEPRPALHELTGADGDGALTGPADLQAEPAQRAADAVVEIPELAGQQLAGRQQGPRLPRQRRPHARRPEPPRARTTRATARASPRSVSAGVDRVAARGRRASGRSAGRPAVASPAWGRCDGGPASGPTRAKGGPVPSRAAASASGSLGAPISRTISRTIAPATQMLLVSSETSVPAWQVVSALPSAAAVRAARGSNRPWQPAPPPRPDYGV